VLYQLSYSPGLRQQSYPGREGGERDELTLAVRVGEDHLHMLLCQEARDDRQEAEMSVLSSLRWGWRLRPVGVCIILAAGLLLTSTSIASSRASVDVVPAGQSHHGASYDRWLGRWITWALATPAATNPLAQPKDCAAAPQPSPKVWFLPASTGGRITTSCTIPAGRAIYVPVTGELGIEDEELDTFAELRAGLESAFTEVRVLRASIDGVPVSSLREYAATSPDVVLVLPKDNILGAPAGKLKAVGAGYSLLVTGLTPGRHVIVTYAVAKAKGEPVFKAGMTYRITIA
jgi:hypothetical protein